MKKKSEDVAHGGMVSNVKKTAIQGNWGIRHVQVVCTAAQTATTCALTVRRGISMRHIPRVPR